MQFAQKLSVRHVFVILLKNTYPISVMNRIKMLDEVVNIYCAIANPVEVIVAETQQGRVVLGVINDVKSKGIEEEKEAIGMNFCTC